MHLSPLLVGKGIQCHIKRGIPSLCNNDATLLEVPTCLALANANGEGGLSTTEVALASAIIGGGGTYNTPPILICSLYGAQHVIYQL